MFELIQFGGVLGACAGLLYSVRVWAWATKAQWLRSDWHNPPAWVRWAHLLAWEETPARQTMFRRSRLARLARRARARWVALSERHKRAWRDRQYGDMRALEGRLDILEARAERFRMLARTIETGD